MSIFKVTRHHIYDENDEKDSSSNGSHNMIDDIGELYSINQILPKTRDFLSSRIFKIEYNQYNKQNMSVSDLGVEEKLQKREQFHYVHLKVRVSEDQDEPVESTA